MKLAIITTLIIALGFLSAAVTEAKVYTWKDESGVMHYSSVPPKPTEKVSDLKDDLRITDNKSAAYKKQKKTKSKKRKNANPRNAKRKKRNYCNGQRRNLEFLRRNLNVKWIENGKSIELTTDQRHDKLRSLENNISDYCTYDQGTEEEEIRKHESQENDETD